MKALSIRFLASAATLFLLLFITAPASEGGTGGADISYTLPEAAKVTINILDSIKRVPGRVAFEQVAVAAAR